MPNDDWNHLDVKNERIYSNYIIRLFHQIRDNDYAITIIIHAWHVEFFLMETVHTKTYLLGNFTKYISRPWLVI